MKTFRAYKEKKNEKEKNGDNANNIVDLNCWKIAHKIFEIVEFGRKKQERRKKITKKEEEEEVT